MKVTLSKVDNGWIVEVSKRDILTQQVETKVTIHEDLESALNFIKTA
jgi:hypothetical protein